MYHAVLYLKDRMFNAVINEVHSLMGLCKAHAVIQRDFHIAFHCSTGIK